MPMHEPVMVAEVLAHLEPSRGGTFVDCTVGLGGHAQAVLMAGASRVIGIDRDLSALSSANSTLEEFAKRVTLLHRDYRQFEAVLDECGVSLAEGILADLGVSSLQLDAPGRGFSFKRDEPLDMRMDQSSGPTVAEALVGLEESDLANLIFELGEERYSRRIARAIVQA